MHKFTFSTSFGTSYRASALPNRTSWKDHVMGWVRQERDRERERERETERERLCVCVCEELSFKIVQCTVYIQHSLLLGKGVMQHH